MHLFQISHRSFNGQCVVIAGAASDLGRATALAFAKRGASIALGGNNEEALQPLASEIQNLGVPVLAHILPQRNHTEELALQVEKHFGRIDVWVNSYDMGDHRVLREMSVDEIDHLIQSDLQKQIRGILAALPTMKRENRGIFICTSSALCACSVPLQSAYCAVHCGIKTFLKSLRLDLKKQKSRIRIALVEPESVFSYPRNQIPVLVAAILRAAQNPVPSIIAHDTTGGFLHQWSQRVRRLLPQERRKWHEPLSHLSCAVHGPASATEPLIESASAHRTSPVLDQHPITHVIAMAATLLALGVLQRHTETPPWCRRRR